MDARRGEDTNSDVQNSLSIWLNGNEIRCLNNHLMPINGKPKMLIRTRINNPHPILLAFLELELRILPLSIIHVLAVDEPVISGYGRRLSFLEPEFEGWRMVPVLDHHGAEIVVPVCAAGAVDDDWTDEAFAVLQAEVRVVPGCAITCCAETVCEGCAGGDGTCLLGDQMGVLGAVHWVIPGTPSLATLCSIDTPCQ